VRFGGRRKRPFRRRIDIVLYCFPGIFFAVLVTLPSYHLGLPVDCGTADSYQEDWWERWVNGGMADPVANELDDDKTVAKRGKRNCGWKRGQAQSGESNDKRSQTMAYDQQPHIG
jgi:hypothetical protein